MALKEIDGSDFKRSRNFDDLNIALPLNPFTKDTYTVKNENAIKQSIKNLVLTVPGEKPFQPLVGSQVNRLLFEPMDAFTADAIKDEIINTIKQHEYGSVSAVGTYGTVGILQFTYGMSYKLKAM